MIWEDKNTKRIQNKKSEISISFKTEQNIS